MKTPILIRGMSALALLPTLCFAADHAHADPILPVPPVTIPPPDHYPPPHEMKTARPLSTLTLDYDKATTNTTEVLGAKVSITFKDASFLTALDQVMNASDKTCRIECRQLHPLLLSLHVQDVTVASLLDSLAKFSGARLYILPSKLLISPPSALTDDEKKTVKVYGVLVNKVTLPDTPDARALTTPNAKGKSILDFANTKVTRDVKDQSLQSLIGGWWGPNILIMGHYGTGVIGPIPLADMEEQRLTLSLQDATYGDVLASIAHLVGCELYMTPKNFVICAPNRISAPDAPDFAGHAIPAFLPPNTNFTDSSANGS